MRAAGLADSCEEALNQGLGVFDTKDREDVRAIFRSGRVKATADGDHGVLEVPGEARLEMRRVGGRWLIEMLRS